ncbi:hypothetical protein [Undibacterium sp. TC9W]|uniref:hypothetical protein n=1 Tax=Undibacterium sp. TC9W TaxID=3413053 RepID=UPI003BEFC14B
MKKYLGSDRFGNIVENDDLVRLLRIRPSILKRLAGDEHADVSSMLGQVLPVFDVYEDGLVWVSLTWKRQDGATEVHAIAVDTDAIELVEKASLRNSD